MKFSMEYDVISKTLLPGLLEINKDDRTYFFYPNAENLLSKIKIVAKVKDPELFYSKITPTPEDPIAKAHFEIRTDKELFDTLMNEFRDLESLLALQFNLKRIDWQSIKHEVICETEEEKKNTKIYSVAFGQAFPDEPEKANKNSLSDLLDIKNRFSPIIVLLSFYREGKNDYFDLKFINAFFNFYFIIEGMFGNQKTRNNDVLKEFKKSARLREFTQRVIDDFIKPAPKHLDKLNEMLARKNMMLEVDALLELIVLTRGELHHFTNNPNRPQNTPFSRNEFRESDFGR